MPTNLPPEYYQIEKEYRAATTPDAKATLLEELISTIPKHKGTDHLRADLRKRLSKLKSAAQTQKKSSRQISPYHIDKEGAGQVVLVGPPNVGKSALVEALTNASPDVDSSPYTTWTPTPGMMDVDHVPVQLVDTPPLTEAYVDPEMINLLRRADLILLVVDLQGYPIDQLETSVSILRANRILPDHIEPEIEEPRRLTFVPMLVLANKCDDERYEEDYEVLCELMEDWTIVPVSATSGNHIETMKKAVFDQLDVIRVFSKPPGKDPDLSAPFVIQKGSTLEEFAGQVHKDFFENLKAARVWGRATHDGQLVGRDYVLRDGDVIELRT